MSSGPPPPTAPAVNPAVAAPVSALVAPGGAVPVSAAPAAPGAPHNSHNPHNSVTAGATGLSSGVIGVHRQVCQIAKFDPFLSLDCARVEGVGAQSKERKGSNFAA